MERDIQTQILLALGSRPDVRLFRNNVAVGWVGHFKKRLPNGDVILNNARPLHAGLMVGSSDLIGWQSLLILPEHVGQTWARFLSPEVKTDTGRPSAAQLIWRENVLRAGGIAGVVRSVAEAEALLL